MPADKSFRQTQLTSKRSYFVLEQFAQRLDQFHAHAFGQTADVMMRFDRDGGTTGERDAFDHVRIKRALRKELGAADLFCFRLEDVDEKLAYRLAFLFGIFDAGKRLEERLRCIDMHERDIVAVAEQRHDLLRLAKAHQPMV